MKDITPLFVSIRETLAARLGSMRHVQDEELYGMIDAEIRAVENREFLSVREKYQLRSSLFNAFRRLDILQELVDRKDVTEIMVNGKDSIFIESGGRIRPWEGSFKSNEQLEDMIQLLLILTLVFLFSVSKTPRKSVFSMVLHTKGVFRTLVSCVSL